MKNILKKCVIVVFLFFLMKGLAWLALGGLAVYYFNK